MHLLPYDTLTLQTTDSLAILLERLTAHIEVQKNFRWSFSRNHKPYAGTLSETGFEIHRIIHYRNSFLPMIRGRFEPSPEGTIVHITMRLHPFVIAFLIFWYLAWYSFSIPIGLAGAIPTIFAFQFLGLPIAILIVFWIAFWTEAHRSRRELTQIILGQPLTNSRSWMPNAMQWSIFLLGLTIAVLQITGHFLPSPSSEPENLEAAACSQHPTHSPYCKFSPIYTLVGHPSASALAISSDGQILVSGGEDKAIKVWNLKTGQLQKTLQSDSGQIQAVAIAPDGKTVVSGSADHMVRIWNLTSNQPPKMLAGHPEEVNLVKITPDGKSIISGSYGAIKVWDLKTGQLKTTFPAVGKSETHLGPITMIDDEAERFNPLDINPASNTALISDREVANLTTNQARSIPKGNGNTFGTGYFLSGYLSLDGKLGVLEYGNPFNKFETRLKVQDLTNGMLNGEARADFSQGTYARVPLALSRDRIFGGAGQQLKVWNLQTAELEAVLNTGWLSHLVVSNDGKLLAGLTGDPYSNTKQIKVWRR